MLTDKETLGQTLHSHATDAKKRLGPQPHLPPWFDNFHRPPRISGEVVGGVPQFFTQALMYPLVSYGFPLTELK